MADIFYVLFVSIQQGSINRSSNFDDITCISSISVTPNISISSWAVKTSSKQTAETQNVRWQHNQWRGRNQQQQQQQKEESWQLPFV